MGFMNRFLLAWLGSAWLILFYALASQYWPSISWQDLSIIVMVKLGIALVPALIMASLIRKHAIAMLLAAQLMTILTICWLWQR